MTCDSSTTPPAAEDLKADLRKAARGLLNLANVKDREANEVQQRNYELESRMATSRLVIDQLRKTAMSYRVGAYELDSDVDREPTA